MSIDQGTRIAVNDNGIVQGRRRLFGIVLALAVLSVVPAVAQDAGKVSFGKGEGTLVIRVDGRPVASYIYADANIPRPYFAHVNAPGGVQVTRRHPPLEGTDRTDHDTMHPGIWMAFGDLDGVDFWRNKAKVVHVRFVEEPKAGDRSGSFVEAKEYRRNDGSIVCRELFRCSIHVMPSGYLLVWDSTFASDHEFYFGDQEEMGIGMRVATPLSEQEGGKLWDSEGRRGAEAIWSRAARWCDYSGVIDGRRVGMTLICHPENFRDSWMHARDYGFVAANPFGRKAMKKGEASKVIVKPGQTLRLRYGVWIHSGEGGEETAIHSAYERFVR